jgi:hypothetical protein
MKNIFENYLIPIFFSVVFISCQENSTVVSEPVLDSVKLIRSDIVDAEDSSALGQSEYDISFESRLLLRRESLLEQSTALVVDSTNNAFLRLNLVDGSQSSDAVANLKLCRLQKNWMMLATWKQAHPFNNRGLWQSEGADYAETSCLSPTASTEDPALVTFVVTTHVQEEVINAGRNYGWVLLSTQGTTFKIKGDGDPMEPPRIRYKVVVEPEPASNE